MTKKRRTPHPAPEVDSRPVEALAGDVLVVAPGMAHSFRALGPERLQMVAIHAASRMETTWLEEDPKLEQSVPSGCHR